MHEKRGKPGELGSERSKAAGGAFRAYGEPATLSEKNTEATASAVASVCYGIKQRGYRLEVGQ